MGLKPGLARLIRAGYRLLDRNLFTAGPKEARAWTVAAGSSAPEAAGVIHTDFQRGFIRQKQSLTMIISPLKAKPAPKRLENYVSKEATIK